MRTQDIKKLMEAYQSVVSEKKHAKKEEKEECPKCKGKGCEHCDDKGYHDVEEAKKEALDPVDNKELDKPFKKRKDKDIDNDGDVDSSDEYLHKRRAATDDAIDARKDDKKDDKKKKKPVGNDGEKTAEISKIGESFESMWSAIQEAAKPNPKKDAEEPEKIDDKESPSSKKFIDLHMKNVDVKDEEETHQTATDAGRATKPAAKRPGDNPKGDKNVVNPVKGAVKEDTRTYREKIMDVLSGKNFAEIAQVADELKDID